MTDTLVSIPLDGLSACGQSGTVEKSGGLPSLMLLENEGEERPWGIAMSGVVFIGRVAGFARLVVGCSGIQPALTVIAPLDSMARARSRGA